MALSDAEKQEMIASTHDAAWNMVDDLNHMRETIAKPEPSNGDLRRMSNLLRRLLIDNGGDLRKISPPRLGRRLYLLAPDVKQIVKENDRNPPYFNSVGVSGLFGLGAEQFTIGFRSSTRLPPQWKLFGSKPVETSPEQMISLKLDGSLSQPVLYFDNQWVNRKQVIKYVANIAGGIHSGNPKEPSDAVIHRIRQICAFFRTDGKTALRVHLNTIRTGKRPIDVRRDGIDFALLQMLAAARYLTMSPDVVELEEIIRDEMPK
jgi:hypothetical protein